MPPMVDTRKRAARGDGDRQGCWYLHTLTDGVRASGLMACWCTRLISGGVPLPRREQKVKVACERGPATITCLFLQPFCNPACSSAFTVPWQSFSASRRRPRACAVPKARATHAPSAPWPGSPALTYARACTGRLISSAMATPLYGGALVATLPAGWIDASDLRPVPDNQEVSLAATQCLLASDCCTQACYHPGVDGARGCRALAGHRAHGETRRHGRRERGTPL